MAYKNTFSQKMFANTKPKVLKVPKEKAPKNPKVTVSKGPGKFGGPKLKVSYPQGSIPKSG